MIFLSFVYTLILEPDKVHLVYDQNVKQHFPKGVKQHFSKGHKLHKIFNKNTTKVETWFINEKHEFSIVKTIKRYYLEKKISMDVILETRLNVLWIIII